MDGYRIVAIKIEDADLRQCSVGRWPDEHGQVLAHVTPAYRVADRVLDVVVGHAVVARRLTDPHADNLPCLPP